MDKIFNKKTPFDKIEAGFEAETISKGGYPDGYE